MILLGFKYLSAGLATLGLVGVAIGVGFIFGSLLVALARNPARERLLTR